MMSQQEFVSSQPQFSLAIGDIPYDQVDAILLKIQLPFCLYMPNSQLVIVIDGKPVYCTHQTNFTSSIRGVHESIKVPELSRIKFDRWGRKESTDLSLSFPRDSWPVNFIPAVNNDVILAKYSLKYINKLIWCYKFVTKEVLVDELAEIDIISFECSILDMKRHKYTQSTMIFPFDNALLSGDDITFCTDEQYADIRALTIKPENSNVATELSLHADAAKLKGNHGVGILLSAISMEVRCKAMIRRGYLKNGQKSEVQVDNLLEDCNFRSLLKDHIKKSTGFDFGTSNLFAEWDDTVRPVRNALAHGDLFRLSEELVLMISDVIARINTKMAIYDNEY